MTNYEAAYSEAMVLVEEAKRIDAAMHNEDIQEYQEHEDYREPLAFDTTVNISVLLACGGPTQRVNFVYSEQAERLRAYYSTTNNDRGEYVEVPLSDEQADALEALYGVDDYAQTMVYGKN